MLFFMFFIVEILSIYLGLFNQYLTYLQLAISFLAAYICGVNPSNRNINSALVMFFYSVVMFVTSLVCGSYQSDYKYLIIIIFVWFLSLQRYKAYNIRSDKFNSENVVLLFYKPRTFREHILSLFGNDTSTMSVVCDNKWAKFKWGRSNICIVDFERELINDRYIIIDTGVKITDDIIHIFYALKNSPARSLNSLYLRLNCVRVFKPLLNELGEPWRYRFMDFLPSVYLFRRNIFEKNKYMW